MGVLVYCHCIISPGIKEVKGRTERKPISSFFVRKICLCQPLADLFCINTQTSSLHRSGKNYPNQTCIQQVSGYERGCKVKMQNRTVEMHEEVKSGLDCTDIFEGGFIYVHHSFSQLNYNSTHSSGLEAHCTTKPFDQSEQ